jgi:UDP-N-acetylmuramyl tripeptide synthase
MHPSIIAGKLTIYGLKVFGMTGTALPGKVAMRLNPNLLKLIDSRCKKKLIITGTNGKTTTNNLINHILKEKYPKLLSNLMGANMPQGIASAFLNNLKDDYDWGIFEVDEGSFEDIVKHIKPDYVLITNFFRDQLDRFGEIENTAKMVYDAIKPLETTLILNADDPMVVKFKDLNKPSIYYGVQKTHFSSKNQSVAESRFCPECNEGLEYDYYNYGQLGKYQCENCGFKNPDYKYRISSIEYINNSYEFEIETSHGDGSTINFGYDGIYNAYNCCAAVAFARETGLEMDIIKSRIGNFNYKLGRMENFSFKSKTIKIVLVKNPIGLTEVLNSIANDERRKSLLFILNDNPADGTDVSWIWDANVETVQTIKNLENIFFSGIRANDIALRLKYSEISVKPELINSNIEDSIADAINSEVEIVYILPTYTAVYNTREIVINLINSNNPKIQRFREVLRSKLGA